MKPKNLIIPVLVFGLVFGSLMTSSLAAQKQKKAEQNAQEQEREFIPKEIKSILQEGMDSRTPRTDITLDVFKDLYLPTSTMTNLQKSDSDSKMAIARNLA